MESDLWFLTKKLTPKEPYRDYLDHSRLTNVVEQIRTHQELCQTLYSLIESRSKNESSQVRYLCLQLLNYIFLRSSHFRKAFCSSYYYPFVQRFLDPLPPPEDFAKKIRVDISFIMSIWSDRFSKLYPQLSILNSEIRKSYGTVSTKPPSLKFESEAIMAIARLTKVVSEVENIICLLEGEKEPSKEYTEILIQSLKEHKKMMESCVSEIADLTNSARNRKSSSIIALDSLRKRAEDIYQKALRYGIDADEFEAVE